MRATLGLLIVGVLLNTVAVPATLVAQDSPALRAAAQLRDYLDGYEGQLGALVAEERFEPFVGERSARQRRVLVSDIGFVRLPGDRHWLGHPRVRTIDGRSVRADAPRLEQLVARAGDDQQAFARLIALENARHNLGHPRTINVPTLPLELLQRRNQSHYTMESRGQVRRRGRGLVRLHFREAGAGAIVAFDDTSFVRTEVEAWVEAATGVLVRGEVTLIAPLRTAATHVIQVEFSADRVIGLVVPTRMTERALRSEGRASYRHYRRFETEARIVPPPH